MEKDSIAAARAAESDFSDAARPRQAAGRHRRQLSAPAGLKEAGAALAAGRNSVGAIAELKALEDAAIRTPIAKEEAGIAPLRFAPKDNVVVLGLITTKRGELESSDALMQCIEDAATYLPIEQLALSPQCGFASGLAGNQLTEGEQWRNVDVLEPPR